MLGMWQWKWPFCWNAMDAPPHKEIHSLCQFSRMINHPGCPQTLLNPSLKSRDQQGRQQLVPGGDRSQMRGQILREGDASRRTFSLFQLYVKIYMYWDRIVVCSTASELHLKCPLEHLYCSAGPSCGSASLFWSVQVRLDLLNVSVSVSINK